MSFLRAKEEALMTMTRAFTVTETIQSRSTRFRNCWTRTLLCLLWSLRTDQNVQRVTRAAKGRAFYLPVLFLVFRRYLGISLLRLPHRVFVQCHRPAERILHAVSHGLALGFRDDQGPRATSHQYNVPATVIYTIDSLQIVNVLLFFVRHLNRGSDFLSVHNLFCNIHDETCDFLETPFLVVPRFQELMAS